MGDAALTRLGRHNATTHADIAPPFITFAPARGGTGIRVTFDGNGTLLGHTKPRRPARDAGLGFSLARPLPIMRHGKGWLGLHHCEPLSGRKRAWKFALIQKDNPDWRDLWEDWFQTDTGEG
jgi:hypothetical protein